MSASNVPHRQLCVLGELSAALDAAKIPIWLRGGWALDFLYHDTIVWSRRGQA